MRYGVLSDIHANLHALDAALRALAAERVDAYLCAGDIVGYGPMPNDCITTMSGLRAVSVPGNHDLIALGRLPIADCPPLARDSLTWTRGRLTASSRAYLERLPPVVATPDGVVIAHGSLDDPWEYVRHPMQSDAQLRRLRELYPQARVLLLGHTHTQSAYGERSGVIEIGRSGVVDMSRDERYVLNPGSVGQSRDRTAATRFMVLDLDRAEVAYHSVSYDVRGCRSALRHEGLPAGSCHRGPPSRLRRHARRIRQVVRGLRSDAGVASSR